MMMAHHITSIYTNLYILMDDDGHELCINQPYVFLGNSEGILDSLRGGFRMPCPAFCSFLPYGTLKSLNSWTPTV